MSLAELLLVIAAVTLLYYALRPLQRILENVLLKVFSRGGRGGKGWVIDADIVKRSKE